MSGPVSILVERSSGASSVLSYSFGPYVLVPDRQSLTRGQATVRIGSRALEILAALIERPGELERFIF